MTPINLLAVVVPLLTAAVGAFVAYQAYRGYRRHDSTRMGALAVGIVCIVVLPYLVFNLLTATTELPDAPILLAMLSIHTLGLVVIYWSIR